MIVKITKIVIAIMAAIFFIVGIPLIINECYKANCGYITVWDGADVLGYYGTLLGAAIAVLMEYADTITAERVKRVINGYGKNEDYVDGVGGNFSYYELGDTLMNGDELNEAVGVDRIREYVYFTETKSRLAPIKDDEPYYLGTHISTAYYFYYDRENVTTLSRAFLHTIKTKTDSYVIYADLCTLSDAELEKYHITFKKIPRDITKL